MKQVDDGPHRAAKVWTSLTSVLVTPLDERHNGRVITFSFENNDKKLAVSQEDADKIKWLLSNNIEGRSVTLEAAEDGKRIRVSVSQ